MKSKDRIDVRNNVINQLEDGYLDISSLCDGEEVAYVIELVKKDIPMKVGKMQPVVLEEDIKNYGMQIFNLCPKCQRIVHPFHISDYSKINYCENCGQKLDWSNGDE